MRNRKFLLNPQSILEAIAPSKFELADRIRKLELEHVVPVN